jgi:ferredoxin
MRVSVDEDRCIAAGQCVALAPTVFDQRDDDGIVVLLQAEPADDVRAEVLEASSVCPARAILVHNSATETN